MGSDGNQCTTSTDVEVKLVLQIQEAVVGGVVQGHVTQHCADDEWADSSSPSLDTNTREPSLTVKHSSEDCQTINPNCNSKLNFNFNSTSTLTSTHYVVKWMTWYILRLWILAVLACKCWILWHYFRFALYYYCLVLLLYCVVLRKWCNYLDSHGVNRCSSQSISWYTHVTQEDVQTASQTWKKHNHSVPVT